MLYVFGHDNNPNKIEISIQNSTKTKKHKNSQKLAVYSNKLPSVLLFSIIVVFLCLRSIVGAVCTRSLNSLPVGSSLVEC